MLSSHRVESLYYSAEPGALLFLLLILLLFQLFCEVFVDLLSFLFLKIVTEPSVVERPIHILSEVIDLVMDIILLSDIAADFQIEEHFPLSVR